MGLMRQCHSSKPRRWVACLVQQELALLTSCTICKEMMPYIHQAYSAGPKSSLPAPEAKMAATIIHCVGIHASAVSNTHPATGTTSHTKSCLAWRNRGWVRQSMQIRPRPDLMYRVGQRHIRSSTNRLAQTTRGAKSARNHDRKRAKQGRQQNWWSECSQAAWWQETPGHVGGSGGDWLRSTGGNDHPPVARVPSETGTS